MPYHPLVSIIIPTYNRADLLSETLDSVMAQTYQNWECLVIDDGSSDETLKTIKKYTEKDPRFKFYHRPDYLPKSGNSCRNFGFEMSKGELVNFFDSDDVMLDDFLSSRINQFESKVEMVLATYKTVDENLTFLRQNNFETKDYLLKDYMLWRLPVLTHSVLFKRNFLENKPLFDPEIKRGQETDFFLNVFQNVKNEEFVLVSKPSFLYRLHENTITAKTKNYNPEYSTSLIRIRSKAYFVAKDLGDDELSKNSHLHCILLLFAAIRNQDWQALKIFRKVYLSKNKQLRAASFEIIILMYLLCFFKKTPKFIEKRWINFI